MRSLLADKDTAEPLERGADGIYWDYDELAKSYVAQKRYGANVVLAWWNEHREQGTDERWERLDAAAAGPRERDKLPAPMGRLDGKGRRHHRRRRAGSAARRRSSSPRRARASASPT